MTVLDNLPETYWAWHFLITWNHEMPRAWFHVKITWFSFQDRVKFTKLSHFTWNHVITKSREEALGLIMRNGSELRFSETGSVLFNFFGVKFELRNGNQKHNLKYDKLWRLRTKMKVSKTHWRFWMPNMALPNILIQKSRRNSGFENFISHFRFWTWILAPRSRFWETKLRSMLLNDRVTEIPPEIHSILINNGSSITADFQD